MLFQDHKRWPTNSSLCGDHILIMWCLIISYMSSFCSFLVFDSTYKKVRPSVKANRRKVSDILTFLAFTTKGSNYQCHSCDTSVVYTKTCHPTSLSVEKKSPLESVLYHLRHVDKGGHARKTYTNVKHFWNSGERNWTILHFCNVLDRANAVLYENIDFHGIPQNKCQYPIYYSYLGFEHCSKKRKKKKNCK